MIPRFFVPHAETTGSTIALPEEEALHLVRVLRLDQGAAVRVFDGRGREWHAVVERTTKTSAAVRLVVSASAAAEPAVALDLAIAILKGDKTDEVIRDAVMLGVAAVQPLLTERTEVREAHVRRGRRRERWQQIAVASAKQCGRAVVPEVRPPVALEAVLAAAVSGIRIALVEPAAAGAGLRTVRDRPRPERAQIVIGPEGGWSPREIAALTGTSMLLTLGRQTLRADAAPIVALSALRAAWDDF